MRITAGRLLATLGLLALVGAGCCRDGTARTAAASRGFAEIAQRVRIDAPAPEVRAEPTVPDLTKGLPMTRTPRRALAVKARSVEVHAGTPAGERPEATLAVPAKPRPSPVAPSVPTGTGATPSTAAPSPELAYDPIVESPPAPLPAPVRRAPAPAARRAPAAATTDDAPITGWHPSPGVAVASGIGLAGLAVGGFSAGLDTPSTGMSALGLGLGAAGFLTAGVIMLVERSDTKPVEVGVGPASVVARGAF
jgi:hypothetical protein